MNNNQELCKEDFSPTPRTNKLLSDSIFENINLDPKCQLLVILCKELEQELNKSLYQLRECELEIKDLTLRVQKDSVAIA